MMKEIPKWLHDFEELLLKVSSNPSSLLWKDELKAFYKQFEGKDEYKIVRFECESLMSTIFHHVGFLEKSFEIDLRLLKENPSEKNSLWDVISRAVGTSDSLNRKSEIIPFALTFLNTPIDNTSKKRVVLLWYASIFAQEENSFFESFSHFVTDMESFLEEDAYTALPFAERIKFLNNKYLKTVIASNSFEVAYSKANQAERNKLAKEYLATKPPKFFIERLKLFT